LPNDVRPAGDCRVEAKGQPYSHQVIKIADYIFAHPATKRKDILARFGVIWPISERTLIRRWTEAKAYNKTRIKTQEKAKGEVLLEAAKESIKRDILTRERALEILTSLAEGISWRVKGTDEVIIPDASDRSNAIKQISKMEGWEAPVKTAQTDTQGNDLISSIKIELRRYE
jgi:hypothetical protein